MDLRAYWDFSDPAASEERFRELVTTELDPSLRYEIHCQIARTFSLRKRFAEAHAELDRLEPEFALVDPRAQASYLLERGRTYNSSGAKEKARECFEAACHCPEDDLRIDALHMLAIVSGPKEATKLNLEALDAARQSADPKAQRWRASLLNNLAWTYHDEGKYGEALSLFEEAVPLRIAAGQPEPLRVARWAVARCLRSLGRFDEALAIQSELAKGPEDGYVSEELGELALAHGKPASAYFARAHSLLKGELETSDPERLARMQRLAEGP